jgi:DNA-directed RNA polymerase subunit RPC12/RpoP
MNNELECRKCGADLENWNMTQYVQMNNCPACGRRLLKKQTESLLRKVSVGEIGDMIKEHLLDVLQWRNGGEITADELVDCAWEAEGYDGVVFHSNDKADRFAVRHWKWLDRALARIDDRFGDLSPYVQLKEECRDRFLVVAFRCATEHFVFDQLGVDRDEDNLFATRIKEIVRLIKKTDYDEEF